MYAAGLLRNHGCGHHTEVARAVQHAARSRTHYSRVSLSQTQALGMSDSNIPRCARIHFAIARFMHVRQVQEL